MNLQVKDGKLYADGIKVHPDSVELAKYFLTDTDNVDNLVFAKNCDAIIGVKDGDYEVPLRVKETIKEEWISVKDKLPDEENYYEVKFENGQEDEKPFRIRPHKNITGFMTIETVTSWRSIEAKYAILEEVKEPESNLDKLSKIISGKSTWEQEAKQRQEPEVMPDAEKAFEKTVKLVEAYANGDCLGGNPMCHIENYAKECSNNLLSYLRKEVEKELVERRDWSASKAYETVIEMIDKLKKP